ncbi:MAG: AAA family ATPase [Anaerolineales bacterium]|nr:AAA family ATPase [Anaerolineales bacterium]
MELLEREGPLRELEAALQEAVQDEGGVALVSGEAGIGKTQLVERLAENCRQRVRVLSGACDALFTPRPLGPLFDIAAQTGGPLLAALTADANRNAIFSAMLAELHQRPTLLIFEDVHWADEATLDLLRFLGRRIAQTQALLVLTYRDDELGPRHPLRSVLGDLTAPHYTRRIPLTPLSEAAARVLVGERHMDAAALHRQTNGNPFFITEVLESGGSGIPSTVRDAVLARANRLSISAQAALQAAAVSGPRIEPWLLTQLTSAEASAIDECLALGMLVAHGETLAFRHELARQTLLETISPAHKLALHRMALDVLKAMPATRQDLARLAHHAEAAGEADATLEYAPAAARKAAATGAHREAATLYALALRHVAQLPLQAQAELLDAYADECNAIDQRTEALAARQKALTLWRELRLPERMAETLAQIAILYNGLGNTYAAEQACDQALNLLAERPPSRTLALVYRVRAGLLMLNQQNQAAIEWAERALALAQEFNDKDLMLATQVPLGSAWVQLDYARGRQILTQAIRTAREAGRVMVAAHAYANLSSVSSELYFLEVAQQVAQEGLAYAAEHGHERYRIYMLAWQAITQVKLGLWNEGIDSASSILRLPGVSATSRVTALAALGYVRVRRGDSIAPIVLDEALELLKDMNSLHRVALVRGARAEAAWLAGQNARAAEEARAAYELAKHTHHPWFAGELAYWLWRAGESVPTPSWLAQPYALQIHGEWQAAAEAWQTLGCPYEQAMALADGDAAAQLTALSLFEKLEAQPAAERLREKMLAAGQRVPRGPRPATRENPFGLTARQLDILALLAEELTNAEIAARLHLSPKTVDHHVSAVLAKLDVPTREAAAEVAHEHGLLSPKHPSA